MSNKQRDILASQMNAGETHNSNSSQDSKPLIEREQVEGTPLWIVKMQNEYNLVMGQYKLNETSFTCKEDVMKYIKKEMWNLITRIIVIISNNIFNDRELKIPEGTINEKI